MSKKDETCFVCWGRGHVYYPAVGYMTVCHYCHGDADKEAPSSPKS